MTGGAILATLPSIWLTVACVVGVDPIASAAAAKDRLVAPIIHVNVIDGTDDRDSILSIGPALGLSAEEIDRIRTVSGHVGCFLPTPSVGTGALFLDNRHIITAAHVFFTRSGERRSSCFFKNQAVDSLKIDILDDPKREAFGAIPPKAGSNDDFAIVTLAEPIADAVPFPVEESVKIKAGDALIVITAHPAGMAKAVDPGVPVAQGCTVRRVPVSAEATSFYRTDCDATGSSSGGMHLARIRGQLVFRGVTITAGPWQDPAFDGVPYDERTGSVTTALGTDAAVLAAGKRLLRIDR
jgi:Trypsin-like peptidase domain